MYDIKGEVVKKIGISGDVKQSAAISGDLNVTGFDGGGNIPQYDGAYEVTPSPQAQVLQTVGKKMAKNITVNEIPYFVTENEAQGNTINIGG